MNRRKFILVTGSVSSTIAVAGCADDEPADEDTGGDEDAEGEINEDADTEEGEEESEPSLELVEHELVEEDFSVEVQGIVRNNGDEEESYVGVEVVFHNEDGTRIDDSFTNTSDLAPDEEWAFSVITTAEADEIESYDIEVVDSPL